MKNIRTKKIVLSSLFAALTCVVTMIVKIPSPLKGYLNLGDCVVLICGWLLSPPYGSVAAGLGSALADVFSGYIIYAPVTFIIKGIMAVIAYGIFKSLCERGASSMLSRVMSALAAEAVMVGGYYVFEGFMYGFGAAIVNILPNIIQGAAGVVAAMVLYKVFEKSKIGIY